jgi:tetratricopeptide (TPR) repeat protein
MIHQLLSRHYHRQGKHDLALEEVDKAFALAPTNWINNFAKGEIYSYTGDLIKAEEEYRKLLEKEEASAKDSGMEALGGLLVSQGKFKDSIEMIKRRIGQAEELGEKRWIRGATFDLAYVQRILGNYDRVLELLNKIWESAVEDEDFGAQRGALFEMVLTFLEVKSIDEAQKTADRLKKMIEQSMNKKLIRSYYGLMGMIELEKNNYFKAIEFFKKSLLLRSVTSGSRLPLAYHTGLAYYKDGDLENSRKEYERVISFMSGRQSSADLYAQSFYMLGKIHEEQGDTAKAIENYQKFLTLWKDADPGIAEVDDARKRLAGLM